MHIGPVNVLVKRYVAADHTGEKRGAQINLNHVKEALLLIQELISMRVHIASQLIVEVLLHGALFILNIDLFIVEILG